PLSCTVPPPGDPPPPARGPGPSRSRTSCTEQCHRSASICITSALIPDLLTRVTRPIDRPFLISQKIRGSAFFRHFPGAREVNEDWAYVWAQANALAKVQNFRDVQPRFRFANS